MIASPQTAHIVPLIQTTTERFVVIDLETGNASESAIQAAIDAWRAPSNWKPETVEAKRAEAAERIREKAALLDASPILCVGTRANKTAVMFNGMGECAVDFADWRIQHNSSERDMLTAIGQWLNGHTDPTTVLVGHNLRAFDLPKLRGGFVRHRLPLPDCLRPREDGTAQSITDTMTLFKAFSMEHRDDFAVSLDVVCEAFGIPRPKQYISGSDVPRLHAEGRRAEILLYNAIDVDATTEVYRLMMA